MALWESFAAVVSHLMGMIISKGRRRLISEQRSGEQEASP
jgi:hypothetical protein